MSRQFELPLAAERGEAGSVRGPGLVDLHSHLVPGVDDGARDLPESLTALAQLVSAGATHVLTTPHVDASVILRPQAFERLQQAAETAWWTVVEQSREHLPDIGLYLGREVMLDTASPDFEDSRVRLNGSRYVLVEFPRLNIPPGSEDVLYHIAARGHVPVVAHVERYFYHGDEDRVLDEWRSAGAVFQVNAPSLLGKYGPAPGALAWKLLSRGWVKLLASDYHARGETWLPEARAALRDRSGEEQERLMMSANPRRVLVDEPLEDVPPLAGAESGGRWPRLRRLFRGREG